MMRVHFTRIDVEEDYDKVYLGDNNERMYYYDVFTGSHTNVWSNWVPTDNIYVNLYSDNTVTDWGFAVDMVEVGYWVSPYSIIPLSGFKNLSLPSNLS